MMSAPPAGGKPTIQRTGRIGEAWAHALRESAGSAAALAAKCKNCLRWGSFMATTPLQLSRKDITSQHGNRPPQCNISIRLLSAAGHQATKERCRELVRFA